MKLLSVSAALCWPWIVAGAAAAAQSSDGFPLPGANGAGGSAPPPSQPAGVISSLPDGGSSPLATDVLHQQVRANAFANIERALNKPAGWLEAEAQSRLGQTSTAADPMPPITTSDLMTMTPVERGIQRLLAANNLPLILSLIDKGQTNREIVASGIDLLRGVLGIPTQRESAIVTALTQEEAAAMLANPDAVVERLKSAKEAYSQLLQMEREAAPKTESVPKEAEAKPPEIFATNQTEAVINARKRQKLLQQLRTGKTPK